MKNERIVVLAHGKFPDRAKTALGVMRYGDQTVKAVLDRDRAGDRVSDHVPGVADAPIVDSFTDALVAADGDVDAYISGSRRSAAASTSRGARTCARRSRPAATSLPASTIL